MPTPWAGPDTNSRCQAFSSVSRPRNLEGPVPGPGTGRIGSSPALRTAARVGLTKRIELCSPDGVPEGHSCGAGVVDAFAPAGCPTIEALVRFSRNLNSRRGRPAPRTDTWRWQPELTASQPTARNPHPKRITIVRRQLRATARQPGFPHPSGSSAERLTCFAISTLRLERTTTSTSRIPTPAAKLLSNISNGAAGSTRSGSPLTTAAGRTLDVATRLPPGR